METREKIIIRIETKVNAPVEKVWEFWTTPEHIKNWNNASDDWYTPNAENNLRVGGRFNYRMEARDGSTGFDFTGTYSKIDEKKKIEYTIEDGRKVKISFIPEKNETTVKESFEAEETNSIELQKGGWQSILDNFKKYVESSSKMEKLYFQIRINAKVEKVYKTMLDEKHYSEWTAEFNPTSYYRGSWEKGSKILFIGTDKDGNEGGMVSRIKENIPNEYVSIEHLGVYENGKERTSGEDVQKWAGGLENYTFIDENGKTLLKIDMDSNQEFKSYFNETWPKALKKLKEICEK